MAVVSGEPHSSHGVGALRPSPFGRSGGFQLVEEAGGTGSPLVEGQAVIGERPERDAGPSGQDVAGRADADDGIGGQRDELQRARSGAGEHEADVGDPVEEHGDDLVGVGISYLDPSTEVTDGIKDQRDGPVRERNVHRDAKRWRVIERLNGLGGFVEKAERTTGVGEEPLSGCGQGHPSGATGEELRAYGALETGDPFADRGLGHQHRASSPAEAALPHHGEEHSHVVGLYSHRQRLWLDPGTSGLPQPPSRAHDPRMAPTALPTAAPIELGREAVIHLATDLATQVVSVDTSFWAHTAQHTELSDGRILSVFDYTSPWTWWERHPVGDEFVFLLSGDVEFLLEDSNGERSVPLSPGQAAIVPSGAWHRAVLRDPSRLLFITPTPARTEHRET